MHKLGLEDFQYVVYDLIEICFAFGDGLTTLFDVGSYLRKGELWVDFTISFDEGVTQWSRY